MSTELPIATDAKPEVTFPTKEERDALNAREIEALDQLGERAGDLRDQLVGLALEVANAAPEDAAETGPEPEPKQRARELVVLAPLHHCDERGEEAILLVAVAAPGHEVGDDLLRVVEPGEHRVLGFGCLERLL